MRRLASEKLVEFLDKHGLEGRAALARTGLSFIVLDRMIRGKWLSSPGQTTMKVLCEATGYSVAALFPLVGASEEEKEAS